MTSRAKNHTTGEADVPLPIDPDVDVRDERAHPERDAFRAGAGGRRRVWDILVAIGLGGGVGSVARYLVGEAIPVAPAGFPWATFLVNVSGCFALGFLMVFVLDVWPPSRYVRPFAGVGFLGGYTTFSTYTVETLERLRDGAWTLADSYAADSLIAGLVAVWCGLALARLAARLPVRGGRESVEEPS